jgi:hypothetical protein
MRYSVRGIMTATFAVAAVCAVVTPILRAIDVDRDILRRVFATFAVGAFGGMAIECWRRYSIEKRCGQLLLLIPAREKKSRWLGIVLRLIVGNALMLIDVWLYSIESHPPQNLSWLSAVAGALFAHAFLVLWWKDVFHSAEICANGIITPTTRFIPWSDLRGYRHAFDGSVQVLLFYDFITLRVSNDNKKALTDILDFHISPKP